MLQCENDPHTFSFEIYVCFRYVVYKYPELSSSPDPLVSEGLGHVYADGNSEQWLPSDRSLNTSGHAIYDTMAQIYDRVQQNRTVCHYIFVITIVVYGRP